MRKLLISKKYHVTSHVMTLKSKLIFTFGTMLVALTVLSVGAQSNSRAVPPSSCGLERPATRVTKPLPAVVSGRVGFYAARFRNGSMIPGSARSVEPSNALFPTASMYKSLVVFKALEFVDQGKLRLETAVATTAGNRSIEAYPLGLNSIRTLVTRAITKSDNTASDILHLLVSPTLLAGWVRSQSECTTLLLTTKAWWGAQAGLLGKVLGIPLIDQSRSYALLPFSDRVKRAGKLINGARELTGPEVEAALDKYFKSSEYDPKIELYIQNTTTPAAYSHLMAKLFQRSSLRPTMNKLFRELMSKGCCTPRAPILHHRYWGAKAGSGWRVLALSGYVEMDDGSGIAYTWMNDESKTLDSIDMEKQIRPVLAWIEEVLGNLRQ